jgi:hypothetical protein
MLYFISGFAQFSLEMLSCIERVEEAEIYLERLFFY